MLAPQNNHPHPPHPWDFPTALVFAVVHFGALLAPWTFSWSGLFLALALYILTAGSVTLGYHRLLTHRSFKTSRSLEYVVTFFAVLAGQGGPITWTAVHRLHHKHSDHEGDPHNASRGFWWAHLGWMLVHPPRKMDPMLRERLTPRLSADPVHRFLDKNFLLLVILFSIVLYCLGGLSWLVYGVFVRLTLVYHATWLINSAGHMFGYRSHDTDDLSTNCWWAALLTFGEGWHNNHHRFPYSARQGLKWWELDMTWLVLLALKRGGLVWELKTPKGLPASKAKALDAPDSEPVPALRP